ncbi:MAG: hypothetical protein ABIP13_01150 [Tepidiformaceae bacterium]
MGHRKKRKRERQASGWPTPMAHLPEDDQDFAKPDSDYLLLLGESFREKPPVQSLCGGCREFIEDQEGGRGTCLHPGSGVLSPWTDTEGCQFFLAQRGALSRRG